MSLHSIETIWIGETQDWLLNALTIHSSGAFVNSETGLEWRLYDVAAEGDVAGMTGALTYTPASEGDYTFSVTGAGDLVEGNAYHLFIEGDTASGPVLRRIRCIARYRADA